MYIYLKNCYCMHLVFKEYFIVFFSARCSVLVTLFPYYSKSQLLYALQIIDLNNDIITIFEIDLKYTLNINLVCLKI